MAVPKSTTGFWALHGETPEESCLGNLTIWFIYKGKSRERCYTELAVKPVRAWQDKLSSRRIDLNSQLHYEFRNPLLFIVPWQSLSLPSSSRKNTQCCKGNSVVSFSCLSSPPVHESNHKHHAEPKVCRQGSHRTGQPQTAWCQHDVFLLNMAIISKSSSSTSLFTRDSRILNNPVQLPSLVIPLPKILTQMKLGLTT